MLTTPTFISTAGSTMIDVINEAKEFTVGTEVKLNFNGTVHTITAHVDAESLSNAWYK